MERSACMRVCVCVCVCVCILRGGGERMWITQTAITLQILSSNIGHSLLTAECVLFGS